MFFPEKQKRFQGYNGIGAHVGPCDARCVALPTELFEPLGVLIPRVIHSTWLHRTWRAFLKSPENISDLESILYKREPLILQGCHFNIFLRPESVN